MRETSSTHESAEQQRADSTLLSPDRDLLRRILSSGGQDLRQCVQCATCSGVCELAAEQAPVPRKEMLWAQWGMRNRLMADVDLWLCHECHDCTARCPRGARPGDVMAALRRECVAHYSVPRFLARAALRPRNLVGFILVSIVLLGGAYLVWDRTSVSAGSSTAAAARIVIPFCSALPHELLLMIFGSIVLFDCIVLSIGLARFWRALCAALCRAPTENRAAIASWNIGAVLRRVIWHRDFARCTDQAPRRFSHTLVLYSMLALGVVDVWVLTAQYNPLRIGLVYPLGLLDPWKLLANLAGAALSVGCILMARDRLRRANAGRTRPRPTGTYFDWLLLGLLLAAAVTGFVTQAMHLARLDAERTWAYAVHLVVVLTFFILLPYSKLAHVGFRTVAMIFAERYSIRRPAAGLRSQSGGDR